MWRFCETTYILQSEASPVEYYVGSTEDVECRLKRHNAGSTPYTAKHRPWRLLVSIGFAGTRRALAFEDYLRSGSGRAFASRHFR